MLSVKLHVYTYIRICFCFFTWIRKCPDTRQFVQKERTVWHWWEDMHAWWPESRAGLNFMGSLWKWIANNVFSISTHKPSLRAEMVNISVKLSWSAEERCKLCSVQSYLFDFNCFLNCAILKLKHSDLQIEHFLKILYHIFKSCTYFEVLHLLKKICCILIPGAKVLWLS